MLKGWKTVIFNVLAAVAPVLDIVVILGAMPEVGAIIPPEFYPFYALGVALANKALRYVTTTPVGKSS